MMQKNKGINFEDLSFVRTTDEYGEKIQCKIESQTIGFIGIQLTQDEAYIHDVFVEELYRRKNIGMYLISNLEGILINKNISRMILDVRSTNHAAINLYKKNGFEAIAVRKNFYDNPEEDGITMEKILC